MASEFKIYRPISNLTFLSKVIERLVCKQFVAYLEANNLLPMYQSSYRHHHSTETVVLKIFSDALYAAEQGDVTLLGMLDMSAAFDTVDRDILLGRLQTSFGICGAALSWFSSFLRDRTQKVVINSQRSKTSLVTSGVPQGSVLGPNLFLLYTADIGLIAEKHEINFHSYADDSELYVHCKAPAWR